MLKNVVFSMLFIACLIGACEKKNQDTAISPSYGATGNPNPGAQTVTGNTTPTNPATENTALSVGGPGWTNPTCGSTFSITLKGYNGITDVTLSFAKAMKTATYNIAATPSGTTACALTIVNAKDQPAGIVWYGKSGSVVVTTTSANISAYLDNVVCTQKTFGFPTVTASGILGCSN